MRIVFCIYYLVPEKLPLQPWLTVRMVADGLTARGHEIHVVTDTADAATLDGVTTHTVSSLRGGNAMEMRSLMDALAPDAVVMLPTPLGMAGTHWLDGLAARRVGFASYSFYSTAQLFIAARCIGLRDVLQYLRHAFVPKALWVRGIRGRLDALVAQSATTAQHLSDTLGGVPPCHFVPPGMDTAEWPIASRADAGANSNVRLLYLGSALPIRGLTIALDAMAMIDGDLVRLRVLARGADDAAIAGLTAEIERRGLSAHVELEGGWIDRGQLIREIHAADAVLQPFVLVPSELPVTAMEVIACGTPVIGSDVDGLPSTIGSAGAVTRQGSASSLAEMIARFADDPALRAEWRKACVRQRNQMLGWSRVVELWEEVLNG